MSARCDLEGHNIFADVPVNPGSPKRAMGNADAKGDAEILGLPVADCAKLLPWSTG